MDDKEEDILGRNRVEDVRWLCCLSESELDLLIDLKMTVLHRANWIHCGSHLVDKFDLKILRLLGFILMERLKVNMENMSHSPVLADICASLDKCTLLKQDDKDASASPSIQQLEAFVGNKKKKFAARIRKRKSTGLAK